ncbi:hypothetical protein CMV_021464 [Castanea mollissima]|uniref:Uncharacterized protein n=1 Tax=Castanea mollissima TaxID=60419 RepID=A0A8J4VEZ9_9ROSI|nr:hypothetical protein CMV_021464 [Castanea mollissima]
MVAGKPCVGEEFACMDVGKKLLKEFKEVYFPSLTVNICDFFPILSHQRPHIDDVYCGNRNNSNNHGMGNVTSSESSESIAKG